MESEPTSYQPGRVDRLRWELHRLRYRLPRWWRSFFDRIKWLGYKPGNIERHAEHELRLAGWLNNEGLYGDMMGKAVLKLCREFADEGHSGMSAGAAIQLFQKVASFEPITPLTGEDDEWNECGGGTYQNRRCSRVFKDSNGRAYDSCGRVFREPSGSCYTNRDSRVFVTFPYTPTIVYVDVNKEAADG